MKNSIIFIAIITVLFLCSKGFAQDNASSSKPAAVLDLDELISEALAEGIAWNNQETEAAERTLVEKFKKAGMEVIQPDYESFRKPVLDTLPKMFEAKWGKGLFERIVETK